MFRILKKTAACVLCLLFLCGCAKTAGRQPEKNRLTVVATIFPVYDFVRAVGGEKVGLTLLVRPGTEIHTFDPAPSDLRAIAAADLFFCIGGESDEWVDTLTEDLAVEPIRLMESVPLLKEDGEDEYDEHIWTSPANARRMVAAICDDLCKADPENEDFYRANAAEYDTQIETLQTEFKTVFTAANDPFLLMADRFAFRYFAAEYGLDYEAAFGGCAVSTDISAKTMLRLTDTVKSRHLTAAFYAEMSNRAVADALREETGVRLFEIHSAHTVTRDDFAAGVTYTDLLRRNVAAFREAFLK